MARPRNNKVKFTSNATELVATFKGLSKDTQKAQKKVARDLGKQSKRYYESTVSTWSGKNKPKFVLTLQDGPLTTFVVGTDQKRYHGIDTGTGKWGPQKASYTIRPKKPGGVLVFQKSYNTATKASSGRGRIDLGIKSLAARTASRSGKLIFAKKVEHPGIKPRHFTLRIQRWVNQEGKKRLGVILWNEYAKRGFKRR